METILDRIIEQKKKEVISLRKNYVFPQDNIQYEKRSLIKKLQTANDLSIIAEFKRASPSKGVINNGVEPAEQAKLYEKSGAAAISVLTDGTFFKGSYSDLRAVREAVELPILCKDFIIDPIQIEYASRNGADLILLIAAALEEKSLMELYQYALNLNLEVLVEVHNREELDKALKTNAKLIGVNNRDLKTFNVTLEITEALATLVKNQGAFLISESGIHGIEDAKRVVKAGASGILVGEALMKSSDVTETLSDFRMPLVREVSQ
jgi:indole-3-glycerol phosphate synthase